MVGLVVVAHSRLLAEGVAEVARAMGVGEVEVQPAGGDVDGGLGTSIDLVEDAVEAVSQGDGVVLLADLGSSILTARMVVSEGQVVLADAPLVEGAVAAASMAATGADLATVVAAAEGAYAHRKT